MGKSYGETYKGLRVEKGYSLKEAAGSAVSVQFLGKFERGESNISAAKLNGLLNQIYVSWKEFIEINNGNSIDCIDEFGYEINENINNRNLVGIKNMVDRYQQHYQNNHDERQLHLSLIAQSVLDSLLRQESDPNNVKIIKNFLMRTDSWFDYENFLFGSFLFSFNIEEIKAFYPRLLKNFAFKYKKEPHTSLELILNIFAYMVRYNYLSDAQHLLVEVSQYLDDSSNYYAMYDRSVIRFKEGILWLKLGKFDEGKERCEAIISAMESLGDYPDLCNNLFEEYNGVLASLGKRVLNRF